MGVARRRYEMEKTVAKHTPGPWGIQNPTAGNNQDYRVASYGKFELVSIVPAATDIPWEERAKNAQLIAAAPELLEALKGILTYLPPSRSTDRLANEALEMAALAIQKAEGSTNAG